LDDHEHEAFHPPTSLSPSHDKLKRWPTSVMPGQNCRCGDGDFVPLEPIEAPSSESAKRRESAVVAVKGGATAFSRTGETATGDFEDAVVLGRYGEAPTDLAGVLADPTAIESSPWSTPPRSGWRWLHDDQALGPTALSC
jgi:hypothetical protein